MGYTRLEKLALLQFPSQRIPLGGVLSTETHTAAARMPAPLCSASQCIYRAFKIMLPRCFSLIAIKRLRWGNNSNISMACAQRQMALPVLSRQTNLHQYVFCLYMSWRGVIRKQNFFYQTSPSLSPASWIGVMAHMIFSSLRCLSQHSVWANTAS